MLESLVLVRQAATPLTPVAEARLAALKEAGAFVLLLPREQYAELAAYQQIFANTQVGNYTDFGRPVTVAEVAAWANGHLSSSVKELVDAVFGGRAGRKPVGKKAATATT